MEWQRNLTWSTNAVGISGEERRNAAYAKLLPFDCDRCLLAVRFRVEGCCAMEPVAIVGLQRAETRLFAAGNESAGTRQTTRNRGKGAREGEWHSLA